MNVVSLGTLANAAGWLHNDGAGVLAYSTPSKTDVGLGSVTNDAQTKAAVVPNTAPAAGQLLVGNAGGTAYAAVGMSGDATLASTGAITVAKFGGTAFGSAAGYAATAFAPSSGIALSALASIANNTVLGNTSGGSAAPSALTALAGLTAYGVRDTSAAYDVQLGATSSVALTGNRALTFDVTNAARTIKLTGNPTLGDWFNQSVKSTSSPTFAGLTVPADADFIVTSSSTASHGLRAYWDVSTYTGPEWGLFSAGIASISYPRFSCNFCRGTIASPAIVQNGDYIGDYIFRCFNGSIYRATAEIAAYVDGTVVSGTPSPTSIEFDVTNDSHVEIVGMILHKSGDLSDVGSLTTGAPTGGTAAAWKLGQVSTGVALVVSTTTGIQLDVGGTLYTIPVLTTNP